MHFISPLCYLHHLFLPVILFIPPHFLFSPWCILCCSLALSPPFISHLNLSFSSAVVFFFSPYSFFSHLHMVIFSLVHFIFVPQHHLLLSCPPLTFDFPPKRFYLFVFPIALYFSFDIFYAPSRILFSSLTFFSSLSFVPFIFSVIHYFHPSHFIFSLIHFIFTR